MFGIRHLDLRRSTELRPGDNKVFLCTAPNEASAESLARAFAIHGIEFATERRMPSQDSSRDEIPRPVAVDLYVRGSDLERARRLVGQSFEGCRSGT
jgi:hypothetical protein